MKNLLLGICTLVLLAGAEPRQSDTQKELAKLKGKWTVVTMVTNGKDDPDATKHGITFDGDAVTIEQPSGESKGTCVLDPTKDPKHIDLKPTEDPDAVLHGIYSLNGDELKVCVCAASGERPTKFESKEGSNQRYAVLKRAK